MDVEKREDRYGLGFLPLCVFLISIVLLPLVSANHITNVSFLWPYNSSFLSGDNTVRALITNISAGGSSAASNVVNVSFGALNSSGLFVFGIDFDANQTTYTMAWNTSNKISFPDGTYTLVANVTSINSSTAGVENISGYASSIILDNTPPTITVDFLDTEDNPKTVFGSTTTVTLRCKRSDSTAGYNRTAILLKKPGASTYTTVKTDVSIDFISRELEFDIEEDDTATLGFYDVNCEVNDRSGNLGVTNSTFEIVKNPPSSTSAFANPTFKAPVSRWIINADSYARLGDLSEEGISRLIAATGTAIITVNGQDHSFTVKEVGVDSATLEITSEPLTLAMNAGDTKQVDVDGDGINDVEITLQMIYHKKADLTFKQISAPAPPPVEEKEEIISPSAPEGEIIPEAQEKVSGWSIAGWILALVIVILILLHFIAKRHREKIRFTPKDLGMEREHDEREFYGGPIGGQPQQPPTGSAGGFGQSLGNQQPRGQVSQNSPSMPGSGPLYR